MLVIIDVFAVAAFLLLVFIRAEKIGKLAQILKVSTKDLFDFEYQ